MKIDYEKLKLTLELTEKYLSKNTNKDIMQYLADFAGTMDELIAKLKELTQTENQKTQIRNRSRGIGHK